MREEQYQPREVTIRKQVSEIVGYNGSRFMYDPNNKTIVEIKHKNKVKSMLKGIYRLITGEQEEEPVSSIVATGEYDCLLWLHSKLRSLHSNYTKNANSYGEAKQNLS